MARDDQRDERQARNGGGAEEEQAQGGLQRDPDQWTTGDESMTAAQASYLQTLSQEAGEEAPRGLSKAEASKRIEELQERTGRGRDH